MIEAKMNSTNEKISFVDCPYCNGSESRLWGAENGFSAVKCVSCGLVYVNPRPIAELIDQAVTTGAHSEEVGSLQVVTRRIPSKVDCYHSIFKSMFADVWRANKPVRWLDVGAGFGEILEAIIRIAPKGSAIEGLEPMHPKAIEGRKRGLIIHEHYLGDLKKKYDFISLVNVFSHVPDFRSFLIDIDKCLESNGEIFIETGNVADMKRSQFSGVLSLPDHLVFSGESHIRGFLEQAGYEILEVRRKRTDTVIETTKTIIKKLLGRPVLLRLPYTSPYRSLLIRARRKTIR